MLNILSKNPNSLKKGISLYLIVVALIISAVTFLILIDKSKTYSVETSIMMIPKSEKASRDSEHIIENLKVFPTKLSFYNKLLRDNEEIIDDFRGLSNAQREEMWNDEIQTERNGKSSIVTITITKADSDDAQAVSKAAVSTLMRIMSSYYDIKNDVDLRVIDGPIARTSVSGWISILILSLAIGAGISIIINILFEILEKNLPRRINFREFKISDDFFKSKPEEKKEVEKSFFAETREMPKEKEAVKETAKEQKIVQTNVKKSPAPENLPGAPKGLSFIDEDYFRNNILKGEQTEPEAKIETKAKEVKEKTPETTSEIQTEQPDIHREPTDEELKKRLNQLLKGEL